MKIILGSASKYRQKILRDAGYDFDIMEPNIDEKSIRFDNPKKLTLALAHAKAGAIMKRAKNQALLITSDQVVVCNGQIREKPQNKEEAADYLASYAQHPAETVTAVLLTNLKNGKSVGGIDIAKVNFSPIPENIIERVINKGTIFSCAGGFTISDDLLKPYIKSIEGDEDSVLGLPIKLTKELLNAITNKK